MNSKQGGESQRPLVSWRNGNWGTGIFLIISHLAAVAAFFFWSWPAFIAAVVLYWVSGSLGIGMGYHRLLTHRAYRVPKLVEYFLVTCGTLALEGGPIQWAVTHRIHHAHTDRAGDPHTPRHGAWWAHVGWILWGTAQNHSQPSLLRSTFGSRCFAPRFWRLGRNAVGSVSPPHADAACNLVRQLGYPSLG